MSDVAGFSILFAVVLSIWTIVLLSEDSRGWMFLAVLFAMVSTIAGTVIMTVVPNFVPSPIIIPWFLFSVNVCHTIDLYGPTKKGNSKCSPPPSMFAEAEKVLARKTLLPLDLIALESALKELKDLSSAIPPLSNEIGLLDTAIQQAREIVILGKAVSHERLTPYEAIKALEEKLVLLEEKRSLLAGILEEKKTRSSELEKSLSELIDFSVAFDRRDAYDRAVAKYLK